MAKNPNLIHPFPVKIFSPGHSQDIDGVPYEAEAVGLGAALNEADAFDYKGLDGDDSYDLVAEYRLVRVRRKVVKTETSIEVVK